MLAGVARHSSGERCRNPEQVLIVTKKLERKRLGERSWRTPREREEEKEKREIEVSLFLKEKTHLDHLFQKKNL